MTSNEQPTRPMKGGRLILATLGALAAAVLIVCGAILPAEYDKDPLGLGKLTGIARLWAPAEQTVDTRSVAIAFARESETPMRSDVIEIPLGGFLTGSDHSELEYKVHMKKGASLVYAWEVSGTSEPRDFHFDQHGHTTPKPGEPMTVATYRQAFGLKQQGALTAPFDGIEGWQFSNSSEQPVVVKLRLTGFYELIPAGREGNLAGVVANVPAAQARPNAPLALKAGP